MELMIAFYMFLIGSILASFFTLVGMRLSEGASIGGRSYCDRCEFVVPWYGLIPVIGYFLLGGKCKYCNVKISAYYPLVEFIGGVLFAVTYLYLYDNVVEYIITLVFFCLMLAVTASDVKDQIVPDKVLLVFLPVILILRIFFPMTEWHLALLGGFAGFGFMYLLAWYGQKRFKQDALGGGDIKLYFLIGIFLEIQLVFLSLFFAALIALITGRVFLKDMNPIPFVPFIFAGSVLAYFFGPTILDWYLGFLL